MRGDSEAEGVAGVDTGPQAGEPPVIDRIRMEQLGRALLVAIGEDPSREGLVETPARWARFWMDFMQHDPGKLTTRFEAVSVDQMLMVTGIEVWSLCEHHL